MTAQSLTLNFHGTDLFIIEHNGQPYTPMKPIVEGMGLDWMGQFTKLKSNSQRWGIEKISIPSLGGLQMAICLPLRKLAGWLATISPNKVRPELRDTIIMYQNECDDVLWEYWTQQSAIPSPTKIKPGTPLPGCLPYYDPADTDRQKPLARMYVEYEILTGKTYAFGLLDKHLLDTEEGFVDHMMMKNPDRLLGLIGNYLANGTARDDRR